MPVLDIAFSLDMQHSIDNRGLSILESLRESMVVAQSYYDPSSQGYEIHQHVIYALTEVHKAYSYALYLQEVKEPL